MAAQSKFSISGAGEAAEWNYRRQNPPSTTASAAVCKLSPSQIDRITQPYSRSFIARIFGKNLQPHQLAGTLNRHLHLADRVDVFELNLRTFVLNFSDEDYKSLLQSHNPWPIPNLCIHVVPWIPNFKPSESLFHVVDGWIRLHELPIEYYHHEILNQIAESVGLALVSIDPITEFGTKRKYARICVRLNLCDPLPSMIRIGGILQDVDYEGFDLLCPRCRCVDDYCSCCLRPPPSGFHTHYHRVLSMFPEISRSSSNSEMPLSSSVSGDESPPLLVFNDWPSPSLDY